MHIFTAVEPIDAGTNVSTRQQKMIYNFGDRNNAHVGLGTSTLRGTIQVPSDNNNFTISPNASEFILEGDYDINAGEFDTHAFLIDGEEVRTETFSYQLNDAAITQASTHSENSGPVSIGRISENNDIDSNDGRRYYGDIQEVIVYNEEITDLQAQQVRSYLSFKYGTTLTNDNNANLIINETISGEIQEGDYVASNGNTITFDYSEDTNFVTNIAGIGRDDDTCLEQKQSRSVNSDAILTIGLGEIASNNTNNTNSFDNDLDFFTWGSNGDLTTFADRTTGVTGIGTVTERMTRIWRAQDNGNVGATDISFDLSGLGYTGSILDYQLIVSPNSSLSSPIIYQASTLASDVLTFNDIDIPDRYYFTIGVAREACGPGGVTGNMVLWLRADLGTNTTIDNNPVTSWSDQSVAANNASDDFSANIAGPAPPSFTEVGTNFNPHITFETGSGEFMVIDDDENVGSGLNPNAHALFIAGTMNTASEQFAPFICKTQDYDWQEGWALAENGTSLIYHKDESNNASPDQVSSVTFNDGIPSIYSAFTDDSIDSLKINNGSPNGTVAANFDAYTTQPILIGSTMNANNNGVRQHLDGNIGDLVMYDATLTVIQRRRIATYLAVKYGITLDNTAGGTNGDYENSNGVTIWDASDYSTYHNDVAGIGRDDASCFAQKQSSSINSGEILTIGLGNVATSNLNNLNHFDDDGDFLLWGNDGGSTLQSAASDFRCTCNSF